mmetsp:Transcript_15434/g.22947  ORF Transcript_15434/g.22947 Transcript_15434/m.22947 type:complete len:243 (-) Transcript_15434:34-762(-)
MSMIKMSSVEEIQCKFSPIVQQTDETTQQNSNETSRKVQNNTTVHRKRKNADFQAEKQHSLAQKIKLNLANDNDSKCTIISKTSSQKFLSKDINASTFKKTTLKIIDQNPWNDMEKFQTTGYKQGCVKREGYMDTWQRLWFPCSSDINEGNESLVFAFYSNAKRKLEPVCIKQNEHIQCCEKKSYLSHEKDHWNLINTSLDSNKRFDMKRFMPDKETWRCECCLVRNPMEAGKCVACEASRC